MGFSYNYCSLTETLVYKGDYEMVRSCREEDIYDVMQIWLDANVQAHYFIPKSYWKDNYDTVRGMLSASEIWVYELENVVSGFIGIVNDHIEGIFVTPKRQSNGIGKALIEHVKDGHESLSLNVYEKNLKACRFYLREGFSVEERRRDEKTMEFELMMKWRR